VYNNKYVTQKTSCYSRFLAIWYENGEKIEKKYEKFLKSIDLEAALKRMLFTQSKGG